MCPNLIEKKAIKQDKNKLKDPKKDKIVVIDAQPGTSEPKNILS